MCVYVCVCVSCLFVCVLMCAKGLNNASLLNKVLIPCLFTLPPPSSIPTLSFLHHTSECPNYGTSLSCLSKINALKKVFNVALSYINRRKWLMKRLIQSLTIQWQRWSSEFSRLLSGFFPEKLTSIWSEASWGLSSAPLQGGRRRRRRETQAAGREMER